MIQRLLIAAMLLIPGCIVSAERLAGFSSPKVRVSYTPWGGFKAEAGTDFTGTLDGKYNPETGEIDVKASVTSAASGVVAAEGERADHLVEMRKAEMQMIAAQTQAVASLAGQVIGMIPALTATRQPEPLGQPVDVAAIVREAVNAMGPPANP